MQTIEKSLLEKLPTLKFVRLFQALNTKPKAKKCCDKYVKFKSDIQILQRKFKFRPKTGTFRMIFFSSKYSISGDSPSKFDPLSSRTFIPVGIDFAGWKPPTLRLRSARPRPLVLGSLRSFLVRQKSEQVKFGLISNQHKIEIYEQCSKSKAK